MRESDANAILSQYLRASRFYCYYELKVAKGKRFSFAKIEPHQEAALPALAAEGLVWKLSDEDSRRKPCDGFCAPPLPAYLVIRFGRRFCFLPHGRIAELRALGQGFVTEEGAVALAAKVLTA